MNILKKGKKIMKNRKVKLFGSDIELDKILVVTLDGIVDIKMIADIVGLDKLVFDYHFKDIWVYNYTDLCKYLHNNTDVIITPLTNCVSSLTMENGYDIIVQNKNKFIRFSDFMLGDYEKSFGREINQNHNWEKMLFNGNFDLDLEVYGCGNDVEG